MTAEATAKAFRREIDLKDGSGVQVFEGDTADEVLDKMAEAQVNATKKISQLSEENKQIKRRVLTQPDSGQQDPDGPLPEYKGRQLAADEEFALGQRLVNPATAAAAHRELIQAELGAPLETVRGTLRKAEIMPRQQRGKEAAEAFLMGHPEFLTTKSNSDQMFDYMTAKGMALTTANFEIAYGELSSRGLLDLRSPAASTDGNGTTPKGAAADSAAAGGDATTPRFASTSIATRGSGTPRIATGPKLPTAEEIDRMSAADHRRWLEDPVHGKAFRDHEERIETARAGRARR